MNEDERWAPVIGYEGLYEVSDLGTIRQCSKGYIVRQSTDVYGYKKLALARNSRFHTYAVHRIIAAAFIPNPNQYPHINHIDEDKTNNRAANLEWCTPAYNNRYGSKGKRQAATYKRNWLLREMQKEKTCPPVSP